MLLSANDSSILQSTTYIFTPFVFGNTVCSQLTTNIHLPCFCNVYVYVIISILQSTTYIFTPFVFGNTVCSQLTQTFTDCVFVMYMFMVLSANDSSILQSTTYIFTPFAFGNTVSSQLTTNIHSTCFCNVYVYVIVS